MYMGLFTKPEQSYLGIDIGAHGMKLVELKKAKGRPQLWTYGILDEALDIHGSNEESLHSDGLSQSDFLGIESSSKPKKNQSDLDRLLTSEKKETAKAYGGLLKSLVEKSRVTTRRATASLPVSSIFHALLTFPKVSEKEVATIVEAEVRKLSNRPVEDLQIVHQVLPTHSPDQSGYMRVLVTAAPKQLVAFFTAMFQHAGLELQELETEAFALERSLVGHDKTTAMIVDVGAVRTNFFIIDEGLPMTHRSVQFGGNTIDTMLAGLMGKTPTEAQQFKSDIGHMTPRTIAHTPFSDVIDVIAKEVQYSFDLFLNQMGNQGKQPEKIILTGGTSVFPVIREALEERFAMKVFVGDPWARVVYQQELKPLLTEIGPRMSTSIGLALRNIVT